MAGDVSATDSQNVRHVQRRGSERLLKQEWRPALTNVVNPKRVTESVEAALWGMHTQLLAEQLDIAQHIPSAQLVAVTSGKYQIMLCLLLELEQISAEF